MLKNYLKIALRSLTKHKVYSFINVSGLSIGIAACLLIMLFVRSEWSYDRFHEKSDRIYRAWIHEVWQGEVFFNSVSPYPLGPTMLEMFPEVEQAARIRDYSDFVRQGEAVFTERMHLADSTFFEVFDFPLMKGDPAMALNGMNGVVLTEAAASRYFASDEDPMGETLDIRIADSTRSFTVTGIAENVPVSSSIQFEILLPYGLVDDLVDPRALTSWTQVYTETYVLIDEGVDAEALEAKLPSMVSRVVPDYPGEYTVGLQPLTDIHLNPEVPPGLEPTSDPRYSYILSAIALLVLTIACINFMTLSMGRSAGRTLEVGVRKVLGAQRKQLMQQFWGEALLFTVLALVLGITLVNLVLPLFNDLAGRQLAFEVDFFSMFFLVLLILLVGLVAGSYPAVVLSAFRPVEVLKGKLSIRGDRSLLQRGLIVAQFALSIFLMISTLTMARQLRYLQTTNLGYDKEQVVIIPTDQNPAEGLRLKELLRQELAGRPEIAGIAASAYALGDGWMGVGYDADDGTYREFMVNLVDEDFVETMGMEMAAGRDFSRAVTADASQAIIINEAFARAYGWQDPIGRRLPGGFDDHTIIGVVKDFNFASLHAPVEPLVLAMNRDLVFSGISNVSISSSPSPDIAVRIGPEDIPGTVSLLEETWASIAPAQPFNVRFLDEALEGQYRQEQRLSQIVTVAAVLAILIACMGLFGLAALTTVRRTKEIGIRKVLGARVRSIVYLLSKDFAKLVLVAAVIAAPAGYFVLHQWLQDFAYRITIAPLTFIAASLFALFIALATVTYHALRAASADPVKALRYE